MLETIVPINPPPRFTLAVLPTPIERFSLSPDPDSGIEIYIKRDDLTGSILSGNKVRKLEFLFYDLLSSKCDTVITCGGVQSNHCRAVAAIAVTAGIECHLVLKGTEPRKPEGNYFLSKLFGAKTKFISVKEYEEGASDIMQRLSQKLISRGKKPYIIPEGGSDPLGAWGYIKALAEIKAQVMTAGIDIDTIVTAVGSGGTYAGLYLGTKLYDWDIDILGFAVCRDSIHFQKRIYDICATVQSDLKRDLRIDPARIEIDERFIGPGYAKVGPREITFMRDIARNSGLVLDPAYTGKALLGLLTSVADGIFKAGSKILFIHTGGQWGLLPLGAKLFEKI